MELENEEYIEVSEEETVDDSAEDRQPEKPKINLDESEEFRRWKSEADKRISAAEKAAAASKAEADRLKAIADSARMETMSDEDRLQYQLRVTQQELQAMKNMTEEQKLLSMKAQTLAQISSETGIPVSQLEEAANPTDAWAMGVAYMKKQDKKSVRSSQVKENSVDVGGGTPPPTRSTTSALEEAKRRGDMAAIYEIRHRKTG